MNYTQLQNNIADYFARADLPTDVFISLAEDELNRTLRIAGMETRVSATPQYQTGQGVWYITYPEGFLEIKTINDGNCMLACVSPHQLYEDMGAVYAVSDETILLGDNDPVELVYYKAVEPLTDASDENLFTAIASDALLYLSLDHAAIYMNQPGTYRETATQRLSELMAANDKAQLTGPLVQRGI